MSDPSLRFHPDGEHILCAICVEWKTRDELEPVSHDTPVALRGGLDGNGIYSTAMPKGELWDVCRDCAAREKQLGAHF